MFGPTIRLNAGDVSALPPGRCDWHWQKRPEPPHDTFAVVDFRVDDGYTVPQQMSFDLRCRMLTIGNVGVVLILFRLPGCPHTFGLPINYDSDVYVCPLAHWRDTGTMTICLHTSAGPLLSWRFTDNFGSVFTPILDAIKPMKPWTEEEFRAALAQITPPLSELWDHF
jgi:hypothetical protein